MNAKRRAIAILGLAITLAGVSEAAQIPGPRHASLSDFVADCLGAAASLSFALGFDMRNGWLTGRRFSILFVGTASVVVALWPLIRESAAYLERNTQESVLVSFYSFLGETFWHTQNSTMVFQRQSSEDSAVGSLRLGEGSWPGLIIHDRQHRVGDQSYNDRFNLRYEFSPGSHSLRIPLEKIRDAPKDRQMDMSRIDAIVVFCSFDKVGREFQQVEIRLE